MFRNSIDRKPLITKDDGFQIRDLTQSMFDLKQNQYENFTAYRVPPDFAMRPDLISQAVYNNTVYAEYILKYNGISNPFTIEEGQIILIPELSSVEINIKKRKSDGTAEREQRIRNYYKYIDPAKTPKKDAQLRDFEKRNLRKKAQDEMTPEEIERAEAQRGGRGAGREGGETGVLPPNIAREGDTQISQRNGRIYFGENIGESAARKKPCLRNGMSSSEFLNQVIRSRKV